MTSNYIDLPTYTESPDQENYNEELNQTLLYLLNPDGWVPPTLTNDQVLALTSSFTVPTFWYNSDLDKLQFFSASTGVQTITSV